MVYNNKFFEPKIILIITDFTYEKDVNANDRYEM